MNKTLLAIVLATFGILSLGINGAFAATDATTVYEDSNVTVECGVSNGQLVCVTQYH